MGLIYRAKFLKWHYDQRVFDTRPFTLKRVHPFWHGLYTLYGVNNLIQIKTTPFDEWMTVNKKSIIEV